MGDVYFGLPHIYEFLFHVVKKFKLIREFREDNEFCGFEVWQFKGFCGLRAYGFGFLTFCGLKTECVNLFLFFFILCRNNFKEHQYFAWGEIVTWRLKLHFAYFVLDWLLTTVCESMTRLDGLLDFACL
jgi:hypothetical protein